MQQAVITHHRPYFHTGFHPTQGIILGCYRQRQTSDIRNRSDANSKYSSPARPGQFDMRIAIYTMEANARQPHANIVAYQILWNDM